MERILESKCSDPYSFIRSVAFKATYLKHYLSHDDYDDDDSSHRNSITLMRII